MKEARRSANSNPGQRRIIAMTTLLKPPQQLTIKADELVPYEGVPGLEPIPLHQPNATSKHPRTGRVRKDGKRPRDNNWTAREYDGSEVIAQCIAQVRNVGIRLTAEWLVIDVDPRNGGTDGFTNLCLDLGIDETDIPCVRTGSGGWHYYLRKPGSVKIVDTVEAYPGVEFKSKGRQVVAAGSIHPKTLRHYVWEETSVSVKDAPQCAANLLAYITRPERSASASAGIAS